MGFRWVPTGSKTNPSTQTWTKQLFLAGKQPDQYKMASDPSHFSGEFARRRPGIRSCFRSRDIYGIHQESGAETAHLYLSVFVCVKRLAKRFLIVAFFFCFRSRFIEFLLPIYRAAQASSNSNTINWMLLSRKMCECHYLELPCMFTSWQTFLMCF